MRGLEIWTDEIVSGQRQEKKSNSGHLVKECREADRGMNIEDAVE